MTGHFRVKYDFDYHFTAFLKVIYLQIPHNIELLMIQDEIHGARKRMVFEDAVVRVTAGDWVLCAHDELVSEAWVLIVMNKISQKRRIHIQGFQLRVGLQVPDAHEEVHCLQRIDNVHLIVVVVLHGVALVEFHAKVVADFHVEVEF